MRARVPRNAAVVRLLPEGHVPAAALRAHGPVPWRGRRARQLRGQREVEAWEGGWWWRLGLCGCWLGGVSCVGGGFGGEGVERTVVRGVERVWGRNERATMRRLMIMVVSACRLVPVLCMGFLASLRCLFSVYTRSLVPEMIPSSVVLDPSFVSVKATTILTSCEANKEYYNKIMC